MEDIRKLYKQLKRYDNEDRIDFNEKSGKIEVVGDYISASASEKDQVMEVDINYEEDVYTFMEDSGIDTFGILAGVLDGSIVPEISEENDKLLLLKRNGKSRITRKVTGASAAAMAVGVLCLILSIILIAVMVTSHLKGGLTALAAIASIILIFSGIILIWNSLKMSEIKFDTYTFTRVDSLPDDTTIKRIFQAVCEKTRTDAIEIKLDRDRIPTLFSSKIGGVPYWDTSKPYPTSGSGEKWSCWHSSIFRNCLRTIIFPKAVCFSFSLPRISHTVFISTAAMMAIR